MKKCFSFLKIVFINISFFFVLLIFTDLIFGSWFKNNFNMRLSTERNINRVYKFDFNNHKGHSRYIRDNLGFRIKKKTTQPEKIDVIFAGGSTINQKFLNYDETIVGILDGKFTNLNFANSGVDGMSIVGHINSFGLWFDKIENLMPKYYIFYIGINDQYLFSNKVKRSVDELLESSKKAQIREYLESNSFFYKQFRYIKSTLFLKFGVERGASHVNKKTVVYSERNTKDFVLYEKFLKNKINLKKKKLYNSYLETLTNKVIKNKAKAIYLTQISGYGMNDNLHLIASSIMSHCNKFQLECFNLAKDANLNYDDFYDGFHLNRNGTLKASDYIYKNLSEVLKN